MTSTNPGPDDRIGRGYRAWALIPIIVLLAYNPPDIGWMRTGFGDLATVILGVWMARALGRNGLLAFAVGCAIASLNVRYYPGGTGLWSSGWGWYQSAEASAIAVFVAWLASDTGRPVTGSILERAGVVREWSVFWILLVSGLLSGSVYLVYEFSGDSAVWFGPGFEGHEILVLLALLLGLANAGRRLFSALLIILVVALFGDLVHIAACEEDMLPDSACGEYYLSFSGEAVDIGVGSAMHFRSVIIQIADFVVAYALGKHVRGIEIGEGEPGPAWRSPARFGLFLLIVGIGIGRYSIIDLDEIQLQFAGSYPLMLMGAFLLGSRLGYGGVAAAVVTYLVLSQVPAFIEWRPGREPFESHLAMGRLLDCAVAALIGLGARDRRHTPLAAPRPLETLVLFAATWTLLLGLVNLNSEHGILWLFAATLAAALVVVGIRFHEERARMGQAVSTLTDVILAVAVLVFLVQSVSGIAGAFADIAATLGMIATEVSGIGALRLIAGNVPAQAWLFVLLLALLVNVARLYRQLRRIAREAQGTLRVLLTRSGSGAPDEYR